MTILTWINLFHLYSWNSNFWCLNLSTGAVNSHLKCVNLKPHYDNYIHMVRNRSAFWLSNCCLKYISIVAYGNENEMLQRSVQIFVESLGQFSSLCRQDSSLFSAHSSDQYFLKQIKSFWLTKPTAENQHFHLPHHL